MFEAKYGNLAELLEGVYEAFENDRLVLCAVGIRTCFDHAAESLKIDPEESFKEKVEELRKKGHISPREKSTLLILTDAGSAAAHRSWRPDKQQCELLMDTIESFIQRAIVLPEGLDDLKRSVPERQLERPPTQSS